MRRMLFKNRRSLKLGTNERKGNKCKKFQHQEHWFLLFPPFHF